MEGTNSEGYRFFTENHTQARLRQINLTLNYRLHQAKKEKEIVPGEY
jgi:ferric enterobactin receptor